MSRLGDFSAELCFATGVTCPKPALFSARDNPGRLQPLLDGLLFDGNNHYVPIAANSYKKAAADFSLERKPPTSKYSLGACIGL
jgi:hypothetical protein